MNQLRGIAAFVQSVEAGSFSGAAQRLGLTPAAVSKAVAKLESELGVRLFQRSTRSLMLTEAGTQFHQEVAASLRQLENAVAGVTPQDGEPYGTLKVSLAPAFGRDYILPMMGEFLERYPKLILDWHFDNRQVDLIGEGFDACVSGGVTLDPGVVARELAPLHLIAVAAPSYLAGHSLPTTPAALSEHSAIVWRSPQTGRLRPWQLECKGELVRIEAKPRMIVSDPDALCSAVVAGMGIGLIAMPHVLPFMESGALVRLLPEWHYDAGPITLYFPAQKQLPAKTRAFVDFLTERFRQEQLAVKLSSY